MSTQSEKQTKLRATGHQPLLCVFIAIGVGILCDHSLALAATTWWIVAGSMLCFWLAIWLVGINRVASVALLLTISATAACWHSAYWHLYQHDTLARSVDDTSRPICLRAEIVSGPRWVPAPPPDPMRTIPRGESSRLEVRLLAARNGETWQPISGQSSMTVDGHLLGLACGDRVTLFARVNLPPEADTPGEFDFRKHLRGERKLTLLAAGHPACVQLERTASAWRLDRWLQRVRRAGVASLWRHVGQERAPLASAMTLGYREQLDRRDWDRFVETGSVHLLAISGLHVGILALGLFGLARLFALRRSTALLLVVATTILYAMLVELRPPVVRATTIIVVLCLARLLGRSVLSFNSLAAAAIVVLVLNPSDLYRIGPQFSFLAVAVLCATSAWFTRRVPSDPLKRLIANTRPWYWRQGKSCAWNLFRLVGASTVIWLTATPLAMHYFHLCSPVSVIVYPLVVLPVTLAMLSGFGVLVFGQLAPPLAELCGWLCDHSLSLTEQIVQAAHDLPGAFFWVPGPSLWLVVGFYGALAAYVALRRGRPSVRWPMVLVLVWISLLAFGSAMANRETVDREELACTFIDVGHGTSVLLELPGGRRILYDAGSIGEPSSAERPIAAALWARGITRLDAVVVSHADADHYNALPGLLDQFSVETVFVSPVMFEENAPALNALRRAIESRGVLLQEIYATDRIDSQGAAVIEVLHPPQRGVIGSDNANSIVLDIEYEGVRILLPGDLESPGLDDVIAEESHGYDVVMAPHHGSGNSNPQGFARWAEPQVVVISGGRGLDLRDMRAAYAEVGARALHTAQEGSIRVVVDREGMRVDSWRDGGW